MRILLSLLLMIGFASAQAVVEERVEYAGATFRIVRITPQRVRVVWKDDAGKLCRTFDRAREVLEKRGHKVRLLMNAGIFAPGGIPCGLHVENHQTLHAINLADAPGNFFLKPNGVFSIERKAERTEARITPSENFHLEPTTTLAVQSGPLLLIDGKRHPAFKDGSANKLHRNGVGVDDKGRVVFAITDRDQIVNLWDFAGLFLKLDCRNALFLDGDISQMSTNPGPTLSSNQFGAMLAIVDG